MRRLGNRFYKTIVILWLTLSIGSVVLAAISWWHLTDLMAQGRMLTGVRDDTDGILKLLLDAETGTRGYVITGNINFLEPFSDATNIRDEGPGFTLEDKARMFRHYGRLSARPTGGEPSTGPGLSIIRKLVLAMGGELACDSNPGQGTASTICLPRSAYS